jgi:hypothetical protein
VVAVIFQWCMMPIADLALSRANRAAGSVNKAPLGGCWVPAPVSGISTERNPNVSTYGGDPATFYQFGYYLPPGTMEYAQLWSNTTSVTPGRLFNRFIPGGAAEGEGTLAEIVEGGTVVPYYPAFTPGRYAERLLASGQRYFGRPAQIVFPVGLRARERATKLRQLWTEIETEAKRYPIGT